MKGAIMEDLFEEKKYRIIGEIGAVVAYTAAAIAFTFGVLHWSNKDLAKQLSRVFK